MVFVRLLTILVLMCGMTDGAFAQSSEDQSNRPLLDTLRERAAALPRLNPPRIGAPPKGIVTARVDWASVRQLLAERPPRPPIGQGLPSPPPLPGLSTIDLDALPRLRERELRPTLIPALVPDQTRVLETVQVYGQIDSYSATATAADGVDLRISGSRKMLVLPTAAAVQVRFQELRKQKPPLPNFGARYVVTRSTSSTDLSFSRFGCGYVLSLICDDPIGDTRCAEDDYIRGLASNLILLNSRLAQESSREDELPSEIEDKAPEASEPKTDEEVTEDLPSAEQSKVDDALMDENGVRFSYLPSGEVLPQSGPGFKDEVIYRDHIDFPTEDRAFLNSQVYRHGGYYGHLNGMEGGQCNPDNFQYPWQDTFCEKRSREQPLCPGGGHEGLDIRPASCEKDKHWAVAAEDARVIDVRRHWVTLQTADGTLYNYLHLNMGKLKVKQGDDVRRGERLGLVSNDFYKSDGSSVPTTIHLHFEMYENYIAQQGDEPLFTKINPYTTLVAAYDRKLRRDE